jgi:hypothetical protein
LLISLHTLPRASSSIIANQAYSNAETEADKIKDLVPIPTSQHPACPIVFELAGSWAHQQTLLHSESFGSSFYGNTKDFGSESKLQTTEGSEMIEGLIADIGLHTLDEFLESSDFGLPCSNDVNLSSSSQEEKLLDELDLDKHQKTDKHIKERLEVIERFKAMPEPSVLKVGGTAKGSFRGNEYDPSTAIPCARKDPRGCIGNYYIPAPLYRYQHHTMPHFDAKQTRDQGNNITRFPSTPWDSQEQHQGTQGVNIAGSRGAGNIQFPAFLLYGLRYEPTETDSNFIRAIHIENLPDIVTLREVLARVRGGEVSRAILMNTKAILGHMSARIEFVDERAAHDFARWTRSHPLMFAGHEGKEKKARVVLIDTPLYPPIPPCVVQRPVSTSRCICVCRVPNGLSIAVLAEGIARWCKLRGMYHPLLEQWFDEEGDLHLEFSSRDVASIVVGMLGSSWGYRHLCLSISYESDPCAGPLNELLRPVISR